MCCKKTEEQKNWNPVQSLAKIFQTFFLSPISIPRFLNGLFYFGWRKKTIDLLSKNERSSIEENKVYWMFRIRNFK